MAQRSPPPPWRDVFVDAEAGATHLRIGGSGSPLVLLHSVGCSVHEYEACIPTLERHFRVIAWDMPGHGDSDSLPGRITIGRLADRLAEDLARLELGPVGLVGASIGGAIALDLAWRHPEMVAGLTLVETGLQTPEAWAAMWPLVEQTFAVPSQERAAVAARLRALDPELFQRWNIDRNKAGGRAMMSAMWALRDYRFDAALEGLRCPVSLLYGEQGPMSGSLEMLCAKLPDARRRIMPDCGHFPMIDDPSGFVDALREFHPNPEREPSR